jgi:hypothetical protein
MFYYRIRWLSSLSRRRTLKEEQWYGTVIAVPNEYRYQSSGKTSVSQDYANTLNVVDALYGHSRVKIPYGLTLVGY